MRLRTFTVTTFATTFALLAGGLALEACSSDGGSGTTGRRVALHTQARPAKPPGAPFTNGVGWTVTLTAARVGVASAYYFDGEPIFSLAPRRRGLDPLGGFLGIRSAHAHPGHYIAGNAMGQLTTGAGVDLFAGTTKLADGDGVSGWYRSGRFTYAPLLDGGAVVVAEGTATKGASSVKFAARAMPADVLDSYGEPKLDGCAFTATDVQADGTVTLAVDPTIWFDQVDFTDVTPSADGAPTSLAGTVAFAGLARGLKKGTTVVFSYASP